MPENPTRRGVGARHLQKNCVPKKISDCANPYTRGVRCIPCNRYTRCSRYNSGYTRDVVTRRVRHCEGDACVMDLRASRLTRPGLAAVATTPLACALVHASGKGRCGRNASLQQPLRPGPDDPTIFAPQLVDLTPGHGELRGDSRDADRFPEASRE